MRKLARIVRIDDILPHTNADQLEIAKVGGWQVIIRKGEFKQGELAVYFEIDSWVPKSIAPFLCKDKERSYNDVIGEKLKTVRLRGELSQGLLIPLSNIIESLTHDDIVEGFDLTEKLGIQKWEPPIPAQLSGVTRGNFPSFIPKTDQERVQNLFGELGGWQDMGFETTIKMDGSSITFYYLDSSRYGVCSRNLDLKLDQEGNSFVNAERKYDVLEKLRRVGKPLAIQGELCGPGIQGNNDNLKDHRIFIFDVYDIKAGRYLGNNDRYDALDQLDLYEYHAPIIETSNTLRNMGLVTIDDYLLYADGYSFDANSMREGVVFKSSCGSFSFKVINNKYLLKTGG